MSMQLRSWSLLLLCVASCGARWHPYRARRVPASTTPAAAFDGALQYARGQGYVVEENDPSRGFFCVTTKGCGGLAAAMPGAYPQAVATFKRSSFCVQVYSNGELGVQARGSCVDSGTMYDDIQAEYAEFTRGIESALRSPATAASTTLSPASPRLASQPPTGAAAFDFGASPETLMRACIQAGHRWSTTGSKLASCSGAVVDLGFPAEIQVVFEDDRAAVVSVVHVPAQGWQAKVAELKSTLDKKYGDGVTVEAKVPEACKSEAAFADCLGNGSARVEYLWRWASGESISLSAGRTPDPGAKPQIVIRYAKRAP